MDAAKVKRSCAGATMPRKRWPAEPRKQHVRDAEPASVARDFRNVRADLRVKIPAASTAPVVDLRIQFVQRDRLSRAVVQLRIALQPLNHALVFISQNGRQRAKKIGRKHRSFTLRQIQGELLDFSSAHRYRIALSTVPLSSNLVRGCTQKELCHGVIIY